jgi:hypothetical protein
MEVTRYLATYVRYSQMSTSLMPSLERPDLPSQLLRHGFLPFLRRASTSCGHAASTRERQSGKTRKRVGFMKSVIRSSEVLGSGDDVNLVRLSSILAITYESDRSISSTRIHHLGHSLPYVSVATSRHKVDKGITSIFR